MSASGAPTGQVRPASVTIAVQAIWSVNAVSALLIVLNGDSADAASDGFVFNAMLWVLYALVTWQAGLGKNWARLTYAMLVALEVALLAAFGMGSANDLEVLVTYLTTPLEFWALYKLFSAESDPWFKSAAK